MFSNFSIEAKNILISAKREMNELKHPYVGSEHLLLAILKSNNEVSNKLKEYNVTYNIFKDEIIKVIGIGNNTNNYLLYHRYFLLDENIVELYGRRVELW